jgi:hypothetical protein
MDLLMTTILFVIMFALGAVRLIEREFVSTIVGIFMLVIAAMLLDKVIVLHKEDIVRSIKEPERKVIQSSYNRLSNAGRMVPERFQVRNITH